mgnify:CR=1 FL=1|tara:strand:- start:46 stop:312 length:267 start_codon:yes stop_codon:yes gene_type:complete
MVKNTSSVKGMDEKPKAPFLPVVSITKVDAATDNLKVQLLNSPAAGEDPASVNAIIAMCLNAAFQLSNEALGAMQQRIEELSEVTEEK